MATQGVLSITETQSVRYKIVTGSDGASLMNVAKVLKSMKRDRINVDSLYSLCEVYRVGSVQTLVVMSPDEIKFLGVGELPERYRETFECVWFNPRWRIGTASHMLSIDLEDRRIMSFEPMYLE